MQEPYDVKSECMAAGMARIVDVSRALTAMNTSKSGEPVFVRVNDDFLEWNNSTFSVRSKDGKTHVEPADQAPDPACDVRTLAQLICGHAPLETCVALGSLQVNGQAETLADAFSRTPSCIFDMF